MKSVVIAIVVFALGPLAVACPARPVDLDFSAAGGMGGLGPVGPGAVRGIQPGQFQLGEVTFRFNPTTNQWRRNDVVVPSTHTENLGGFAVSTQSQGSRIVITDNSVPPKAITIYAVVVDGVVVSTNIIHPDGHITEVAGNNIPTGRDPATGDISQAATARSLDAPPVGGPPRVGYTCSGYQVIKGDFLGIGGDPRSPATQSE